MIVDYVTAASVLAGAIFTGMTYFMFKRSFNRPRLIAEVEPNGSSLGGDWKGYRVTLTNKSDGAARLHSIYSRKWRGKIGGQSNRRDDYGHPLPATEPPQRAKRTCEINVTIGAGQSRYFDIYGHGVTAPHIAVNWDWLDGSSK